MAVVKPQSAAAAVVSLKVDDVLKVDTAAKAVFESLPVGMDDSGGTCKERSWVECAGLSGNSEYNCTRECGYKFTEDAEARMGSAGLGGDGRKVETSKVTAEVKPAAGDNEEETVVRSVKEVASKVVVVNVQPVQTTVTSKEERKVHPISKPGDKVTEVQPSRSVAKNIKTVLETVMSVLLRILVCLLVAGLLGSVVMGQEERFVRRTSNGNYCEFVDGGKVHSVMLLRGKVGKVYFGEVHLSKFVLGGSTNPARRARPGLVEARGPSPWSRGKKEDDVMMLNNRSTHAPGSKLLAPTSTRRREAACRLYVACLGTCLCRAWCLGRRQVLSRGQRVAAGRW